MCILPYSPVVGRDVPGASSIAQSVTVGRDVPARRNGIRNAIMRYMNNHETSFKRNLRQFRILTIVGYSLLLFIIIGMVVASELIPRTDMPFPTALPIALVGIVLMLGVAGPFLWAAYDKTTCPHCGKGTILRGRTAYGCSRYREGCTFLLPYLEYGAGLSDDQLAALLKKNL